MRFPAWLRRSRAASVSRGCPLKTAQDRPQSVRTATRMRQTGGIGFGEPRAHAVFDASFVEPVIERGFRDPEITCDLAECGLAASSDCDHVATELGGVRLRHGNHPFRRTEVLKRLEGNQAFSSPLWSSTRLSARWSRTPSVQTFAVGRATPGLAHRTSPFRQPSRRLRAIFMGLGAQQAHRLAHLGSRPSPLASPAMSARAIDAVQVDCIHRPPKTDRGKYRCGTAPARAG